MVIGKNKSSEGDTGGEEGESSAGGYTIGGDINIYEWDHESMMPVKDVE